MGNSFRSFRKNWMYRKIEYIYIRVFHVIETFQFDFFRFSFRNEASSTRRKIVQGDNFDSARMKINRKRGIKLNLKSKRFWGQFFEGKKKMLLRVFKRAVSESCIRAAGWYHPRS